MAKKTAAITWKPGTEHPAIEGETYVVGMIKRGPCAIVKSRHGSLPCFEGEQIREHDEGGHAVFDKDGKEVMPGG